ncbi:MAG TPA: 50S ribosomal protein L32 [bacterium]|jgi:large subunit ribosomal protein L32|nr:50S ribosomal protein L32 [bacterium]
MSVPKRRKTRSAVGQNRSHLALKPKTLNSCPKCGQAILPHTACGFCGTYKGKTVLTIKDKKAKSKK